MAYTSKPASPAGQCPPTPANPTRQHYQMAAKGAPTSIPKPQ